MLLYRVGSMNAWWHTHPSFSDSPLQSTTGPPLPMRSRVCKLTGNKQVVKVRETTVWQSRVARICTRWKKGEMQCICTDDASVCPALPTIWPRTASLSEGFSLHRSRRWSGGRGDRKCMETKSFSANGCEHLRISMYLKSEGWTKKGQTYILCLLACW